jgi:tetratricopeptide (TPR) repeat protein
LRRFRELRNNRDTQGTTQLYADTGIRMVERGDLNVGIAWFRQAVKLSADFSEMDRNFTRALFQAGKWDEAGKEYGTSLRLGPRFWQAHCGLGEMLVQQNRAAAGIKEVEAAMQLNPRFAPAYDLLCLLYRRANDPAKSAAALARANTLDPKIGIGDQTGRTEAGLPPNIPTATPPPI